MSVGMEVTLYWQERDGGQWYEAELPPWRQWPGKIALSRLQIRRAPSSRNGRWALITTLPLEGDDKLFFPQYYWSLDVAKEQAERWANDRREFDEARVALHKRVKPK